MATAKELRAQLAVAELEEKLAASKKRSGRDNTGKAYRKLKEDLRQARMEYRAARDGLAIKTINGRKVAVEADAK